MLDTNTDRPPSSLIDALRTIGLTADRQDWTRLSGGRTNRLWRFRADGRALVCKLFAQDGATPLFPNDAGAEARALQALVGTALAPKLLRALSTPQGPGIVYDYIESRGAPTLTHAAQALADLHRQPLPTGFRLLNGQPGSVLDHGAAMLRGLSDGRAVWLMNNRPAPLTIPTESVFLHGDPVPANLLATPTGPCLIDWQCPALGDPTEDLAIYLSPAMQHLYGGAPLDERKVAAFLTAYGDPIRATRYHTLAPAYHWRMAVYCLWKTAAGDADYSKAADLEIACLKQIGQP